MTFKKHTETDQLQKREFLRIIVIIAAVYLLLVVSFFFLAGDQLRYRVSRGEIAPPAAESATGEIVAGMTVEQEFSAKIDRMRSIAVQWGTYYRTNHATALLELFNQRDSRLLASQQFDLSALDDGAVTELRFSPALEGMNGIPMLLRVTTDASAGNAPALLLSASAAMPGSRLTVNGKLMNGALCLSATGEDHIWTGLHYWKFSAAVGLLLAAFLLWSYYRAAAGKIPLLLKVILAVRRYDFLIRQLVNRDFKTKYKRSILGIFWSFLNPLLTMIVQYIVFSSLFRFDVPYYPVYLLCGIVLFNYFSEACSLTLTSIVGNASLITKVYVPKYIYPLTRVFSSLINLLISMIPLLLVSLFSGIVPTKAYLLAIFPLACLAVFCLGMGMLLCTMMVFFRDTQFLWNVLSMIWMYLTPIFYPASILPDDLAWVLQINPLYHFIDFLRTCIISGISPEPRAYAVCAFCAVFMFAVGAFVFKKSQDKFVLYL